MGLRALVAGLVLLLTAAAASALEPAEILLIASQAPESKAFAEYYAKQRNVPESNILIIEVPGQEQISRADYTEKIAKPVREHLQKHDPDRKIKCLLTFYGLPIRVGNRSISDTEREELKLIREELKQATTQIGPLVRDIEQLVKQLDPDYKPPTTQNVLPAQAVRVDRAVERLVQRLNVERDADARRKALERLFTNLDDLIGPSGMLQRPMFKDLPVEPSTRPIPGTLPTTAPATEPAGGLAPIQSAATRPGTRPATVEGDDDDEGPPDRRALVAAARLRNRQAAAKLTEFARNADDPKIREEMREFAKAEMGLITYARVLEAHGERLEPGETNAAVDNELALVYWGDNYPLYRWIDNPHYFRTTRRPANQPPVLMVMRLDGAGADTVRNIIRSSMAAEEEGLGGKLVIDSRGIQPKKTDGSPDAYGEYDQALRDLAALVKARSEYPVVLDEQPAVLPPHSQKDVGLYIGWYALRNYLGSCDLRNGAVGFHVASLEMVSIKQDGERGWVRGLLDDGIAATCGAVAEPYLHSFPKPDEFFPLLMTGELTLAEVYWRTAPLVSWQVAMIGDPLYRPFAKNPAMKVEDLPGELRAALRKEPPARR